MEKPKFKFKIRKIVNNDRVYPANLLAELFLKLMQNNYPKTFTKESLDIIKDIGEICQFILEEASDE